MPDQTGTHTTPPGGGENTPPPTPVSTTAAKGDRSRQEQLLLPEESVADFRLLRFGMHEDLRPRGVLETALVERYIVNQWRMERCAIMEAELIAHRREYATAWANPRRVKTTPTAGAVWGDDQQYYGGALEKLAKYEYRLSLECSRILRHLAQRQKARVAQEEVGAPDADGFVARMDALREARAGRATAGEPQISQMDADELQANNKANVNLGKSAQTAVPNPMGHATERKPISGNLQNELPPPGRTVNAPAKEAKPVQGNPRRAPHDTDVLRAEIERRVNRLLTREAGALSPLRHTWVGSGA